MNVSINYPARVQKLQTLLAREGLDAYVASRFSSLSYLAGVFIPWRSAVVVPRSGQPVGIWWERDYSRIVQDGWMSQNIAWGADPDWHEAIAGVLEDQGAGQGRVAFEFRAAGGRVAMGILHAFEYQELLARLPQVEMSDGCPLLDQVMLIKEKQEIALLRQAAAIADAGFLAAREALRPGVSENHVAGVAEAAMRDLGNEFNWSQSGGTEVGSGHRTAYLGGVTQPATQKIIQDGDNIILDLHPMYRLYMADACYNLVVGKAGAEQRRLAGVWEKAVETLLAQSCPGVAISAAAKAAYQVFEEAGLGEYGLRAFGHGLGVDTRVTPSIGPGNDSLFQENMVIAAGAHLYVPGVGGMRLELPTLITADGAEPLCRFAQEVHLISG
ncbi:Xaa-Pro peptidase family protein [Desulfoferula mesophila]|uniref:Xaa-Pro dipeptidase n=1 Tax=Desulfoferula mesophila TaxID=3058419 RepID=A0AAU9E7T0_9BACT|nr:Xaa-Pro dipeptidase [Desulfoferula mesophilus]